MNGPDFSAFRHALSQFPTGVTIVTSRSPSSGDPVGLTISSFNSVSLNPALVLWSLSNQSQHLSAFGIGHAHRIHVLSHLQQDLANRFARPGTDKFSDLNQLNAPGKTDQDQAFASVPCLADCSARFDCTTENVYQGGDHSIILARVLYFETSEHDPLVFAHSSFFGLSKLR